MDSYPRLNWQCRRGSKELDILLQTYLENRYPVADEAEKELFVELLQCEDSILTELLLHSTHQQSRWLALVSKIRNY